MSNLEIDMNQNDSTPELNRRDFLKGGSFSTLMLMMGGIPLTAPAADGDGSIDASQAAKVVRCGVIGCGIWGREILNTLAQLPGANVVAVCDTYEAFLNRAKRAAPNAEGYEDYRALLANPDVQAVIVATPSHQHREIALAAMAAGKHVYCEAPLATSIEDARAIARAARDAVRVNFQSGLQMRSDPQRHFLVDFIRAGALGRTVKGRGQWHKKQSWRRVSPTPEREEELNWRLRRETSPGLMGEIGIHQLDVFDWFFLLRPSAVTGFGNVLHWRDGREVADTIQAVFEYPQGVRFNYEATLANSFDADYEMFYGTDAAVMLRKNKAWMFKEVDAPLLGWEVYARKDKFYEETGIALVANATQLVAQGENPVEEAPFTNTPLFYSLEAFLANSYAHAAAVEDFTSLFGAGDNEALADYLKDLAGTRMPAAGFLEGFEATVTALKANEAIARGERLTFEDAWYEI
jgi:predicted dehydrogenase